MYFWKIDQLKSDLASRPLSDRETLPYLILFVMIYEAVYLLPPDPARNHWDYAGDAGTVVLSVLGTIYLYSRNGGAGGRDFISRYLAVGWVFAIRFAVLVVPLFLFMGFVVPSGYPEQTNGWLFLIYLVIQALYYWRLGWHLRDLVRRAQAQSTSSLEKPA